MSTARLYDNVDEVTKMEIINVKRLITAAGKIQDRIASDVKALEDLKKEIKAYEMGMATSPTQEIVLVSGTHVAALSAT